MRKAAILGSGSAPALFFGFVFNEAFLKTIAGRAAAVLPSLPAGEIWDSVLSLGLFLLYRRRESPAREGMAPVRLQLTLFISTLLCGFIGGIPGAAADYFRLLHLSSPATAA